MAKISRTRRYLEIIGASTKLGLTSFGGPVAHLGYFRDEYVKKRKWLDERTYADLIALCQFLPGPASSQVGIAVGMLRGGLFGGVLSWIGFTLPSVIALVIFAYLYTGFDLGAAGWIHGLKIVAVAVVAQALLGMGRSLAPDLPRIGIAIATASITLMWPSALGQLLLIGASALVGLVVYQKVEAPDMVELKTGISKKIGIFAWIVFFSLLAVLPLIRQFFSAAWFAIFDTYYRVGSLVFGGGHVVLPMLEREVVPVGWVGEEAFLAGYGAAQAVPGPLFTFAGYLGAVTSGWSGALIAIVAIFLPSFLMVVGALPFWERVRKRPRVQAALYGVNAAVVGILLAALYDPVFTSAIKSSLDFVLAMVGFSLLTFWKVAPWIVVALTAVVGWLLF